LHCLNLVLDGSPLHKIIARLMKLLTRRGVLVEERGRGKLPGDPISLA